MSRYLFYIPLLFLAIITFSLSSYSIYQDVSSEQGMAGARGAQAEGRATEQTTDVQAEPSQKPKQLQDAQEEQKQEEEQKEGAGRKESAGEQSPSLGGGQQSEASGEFVRAEVGFDTSVGGTAGEDEVELKKEAKPHKSSPFRNSYFVYENTFSAYTLKKDAELTYSPYYAMSYSFRPRYYLWKGLYVGLRWDIEQELTDSETTTKKRQVMWSDVLLDLVWGGAYTIPALEVSVRPKIRIELPASLASQAKTLYLSLGPGFDLIRIFDLWGGITLMYAFRYTKYFNQYASTLSEEPVLECPEEGSCQYDVIGPQNPSMRFTNDFWLEIRPVSQFYFSVLVEVRNYLLYKVPEAEIETVGGTVEIPSRGKIHMGYMWYMFELGYDVLPWLTLSLGSSTYNPMLKPESKYYPPFFNRFTNLFFDISLNVDKMIGYFTGREKGFRSAEERVE